MTSRFASLAALGLVAFATAGCAVVSDVPLGADDSGGKVDSASAAVDSGAPGDPDGGVSIDSATADFDGGESVDSAIGDWDGGVAVDSAIGDWDGGEPVDSSIDWDGGAPVCADAECGPSSGAPSCLCSDGSLGCNTGRCLRNLAGTCGWEYRVCP
jgi:hypothetical protein